MKLTAMSVALAMVAGAVQADEVRLISPDAGASLSEAGVDMSVYWSEVTDGMQVVATYTASGTYDPARIVMVLADGDAVSFGLPGQSQVYYGFARDGDELQVNAVRPSNLFAQK